MASASSNAPSAVKAMMKLKLMIDKTKKKVVFAEADKPFVDFILHMLALPISAILSITTTNAASPGGGDPCLCLANLYKALANMHRQTNSVLPSTGPHLLNPTAPITSGNNILPLVLPIAGSKLKATTSTVQHYRCPGNKYVHKCRVYVADDPAAVCPECGTLMTEELIPVEAGGSKVWGGYVKDIPFMVMDDLEVKPLNVTSVVALLKNLDVVEEKMVNFGTNEGVKLLKAAMESKGSALTDVFLNAVKEEGGDGDGDGLSSTINKVKITSKNEQ